MKTTAVSFVLALTGGAAHAGITGVALGPGGSSGTRGSLLGPYSLTAFPRDSLGGYSTVTSLPSPLGGSLGFSPSVGAADVGSTWATWSGGYFGDIYWTMGSTSLDMTLPANTSAFVFYTEPNPFAAYTITATANDGTTVSQDVEGSAGAAGYGFYTDGAALTKISVSSAVDFAVGEFWVAKGIPAPASLGLLGLGGLINGRRRR